MLKLYQSYIGASGAATRENSNTTATPPGFSTRRISASATSLRVTLRSPNAIETMSNARSANGRASALHWIVGRMRPASSILSRPSASIAPLMSVCTTVPDGPTRAAKSFARSPVPPAKSSTRLPARAPETSTAKRFHNRCSPADMTSFITSYLLATESNTPRTRRVFSSGETSSKPKWVRPSLIASVSGGRVAAGAGGLEPREIALPQLVLPHAQVVEVIPRINARVVAVGEFWPDRIVVHGLQVADRHVALADLHHLLPRSLPATLRQSRIDEQAFAGHARDHATGDYELDYACTQ